ncbi:MAG TPA: glycosyltransferase [Phenylobacterium sp.]|nr:glycosyltransferase [Phenylobacterium sp.]
MRHRRREPAGGYRVRRIVYGLFYNGRIAGGHKMILRHVETLRDLGFDAVCHLGKGSGTPDWFDHRAPVVADGLISRHEDIVVLPDDGTDAIRSCAAAGVRTVVLVQNPYYFAASESFEALDGFPAGAFPTLLAVAPGLAATLRRLFPQAQVAVTPCFADERIFAPAAEKSPTIVYTPRKRQVESQAIRHLFPRLHPNHADLGWAELNDAPELAVAKAFGAAGLFLSLSRLESVGMTPLEAMAAGCVCAGFTGVGGREYATPENGFWADEDDCEMAADALAEAADLVKTGGAPLARHIEAGRETAARWSHAAFRIALEAFWMTHAPEARLREGPLDPP